MPKLKFNPNALNDVNIRNLSPIEFDAALAMTAQAKANEELICIEVDTPYADIMLISRPAYKLYLENGGQRMFHTPDTILSLLRRHQ